MSEQQKIHSVSAEIAGRTLTIETGRFAELADGAVTVRYGDTMLLATVVSAPARPDIDFFPLTVDFEERMYSAGRIPGSYFKREGRPTTSAILIARLTDRPLRPLFPKGFNNEVQVIITALSMDMVNDPAPLSVIGASAALSISSIPFNGPLGAVQMGFIDGKPMVNPPMAEMADSRLDLMVAGTKDAVLMVEAGAHELTEDEMLQGVIEGHAVCKQIAELQEQLVALCGKEKQPFVAPEKDLSLQQEVKSWIGKRLKEALYNPDKAARQIATDTLGKELIAHFTMDEPEEEIPARTKVIKSLYDAILKEEVRSAILKDGIRVDGRATDEIRKIEIDVGMIPRVHGSGMFHRGQTQVLNVTTLGAPGEEQRLDDLGIESTKRYIHHYNFPPYSTGEVKRLGSPRRRDIGHGALAERSLLAVLPEEGVFPYTLRLVSETFSSNGSSSMASVCASSLSLMDAGVPIKSHVAGIAMGLVTGEGGSWRVLTDIQGIEDALGDMDFKVAGTAEGVTGLQMDIKTTGITYEIMGIAFEQARQARLFILDKMNAVIDKPRADLSPYAPRVTMIQIPVDKIGAVIGPGGKTIRGIIDETGATIDIEDDGRVFITAVSGEAAQKAIRAVEGLTREAKVGELFTGKVVRIIPAGAFVNILPGKDGLVHISEIAEERVRAVEDVLQVGDEVNVVVIDVDPGTGKVALSRRAVLTGDMTRRPRSDRPEGGDRGGDRRGGGGYGDRRGGDRPNGGGGRDFRGGDRPSGNREGGNREGGDRGPRNN